MICVGAPLHFPKLKTSLACVHPIIFEKNRNRHLCICTFSFPKGTEFVICTCAPPHFQQQSKSPLASVQVFIFKTRPRSWHMRVGLLISEIQIVSCMCAPPHFRKIEPVACCATPSFPKRIETLTCMRPSLHLQKQDWHLHECASSFPKESNLSLACAHLFISDGNRDHDRMCAPLHFRMQSKLSVACVHLFIFKRRSRSRSPPKCGPLHF